MEGNKRDSMSGKEGPVKRRRSERLLLLDDAGAKASGQQQDVENRSVSAPKQRTQQGKPLKRRSAPAFHSGRVPLAEISLQGRWGSLQEELLILIVQKLAPQPASIMRLVCKAWKRAVEQGLSRLQTDTPWGLWHLRHVQHTYPRLQSLDLQLCANFTALPEPLHHMSSLRHLRICKINALSQSDWTKTIAKLRQLHSLAVPGCTSLVRINLGGYKNLQRLDLTTCTHLTHITTPTMLPSLTCLNLRECQNIRDWNFLQKMLNLEALDLSYCCQVGDREMEMLSEMPRLHLLILMHCRGISNNGLAYLARSPSLLHIYLDGCSMISEEAMRVMEVTAPHINTIRFSL